MAVSVSRHYKVYSSITSLLMKGCVVPCQRDLHTSHSLQIDRRKDRAIVQHLQHINHEKSVKHRNLPIINLPDYSYVDGRATEISTCQKQRSEKNYQMAKRIVQLVEEMKFAQEQLMSQTNEADSKQQQRLDSRLKEKGKQM